MHLLVWSRGKPAGELLSLGLNLPGMVVCCIRSLRAQNHIDPMFAATGAFERK